MATKSGNVARFPSRKQKERAIRRFADGYLESLYYRDEWRSLARSLSTWPPDYVSPRMHQFVLEMMGREKRPTIRQLATLVGLMVTCEAQYHFEKIDNDEAQKSRNVVPMKPRK